MFHLFAYSSSVGAVTLAPLAALPDAALTISPVQQQYLLTKPLQMVAAAVMGALLTRAQIQSPSLRVIGPVELMDLVAAAGPATLQQVNWWGDQPFRIAANEGFGPYVSTSGAGPQVVTALFWAQDDFVPVRPGQVYRVHASSTVTAVANTWTLGSFVLDQPLPPGTYQVVNSWHVSATAIAHRLAFQTQVFRPGSLSHQLITDIQDMRLATRRLGGYGEFLNTSQPMLEVLCSAADAAHDLWLELVPVNVPMLGMAA